MATFFVEPERKRIAIAAAPKVACCSLRMWLYQIAYRERPANGGIFKFFAPYTFPYEKLPCTVEMTIAVHRDSVSRLRSVYDHRIRVCREARDFGIDHFARHLADYTSSFPPIAHHATPQHRWLGSRQNIFTHIVPLNQLDQLHRIVSAALRENTPSIPRSHTTKKASLVSPLARIYFNAWGAMDSLLGWDGKTSSL